ncbi:MAG: ribose 5-phosphate isomerase B [Desulfobacteraceae bacterium 4572_35.2]|nr:MAG: ribose 5-phosphate isomerase B [Desulfobacteraceae bacterium 4572_35.2]
MLIASDHGGLELKQIIVKFLLSRGIEVNDLGVHADDSVDYPDYAALVATPISNGDETEGILVCGTGIGMSIAANKFSGVRAALVHDEFTAQMAREHNNANILVLGGRVLKPELACRMVEVWLNSQFEGGRHQNRLNKIIQLGSEVDSDK